MISPQEALAKHNAQTTPSGGNPFEIVEDSRLSNRRLGMAGAALTGLVLVGAALAPGSHVNTFEKERAAAVPATDISPESIPEDALGGVVGGNELSQDQVRENFARSAGELARGFKPGEVVFGSDIDLSAHTEVRGSRAFSQDGVYSQEDMQTFFASNTAEANAVKENIVNSKTLTPEEKEEKLAGKGYVLMQIKAPAVVKGTSYFVDGQTKHASERSVPAGDLYLLSVKKDGNIDKETSKRCDCANPNIDEIVPQSPDTPPPPSVSVPPRPEETTTTTQPQSSTTEVNPSTSSTTPSSSSTSTSTSTSSTSTSTSTSSTTSTTNPNITTTTLDDKHDDNPTPGPDDNPGTTQPHPNEEPTPDDDSENPVGSTSTVPPTSTPGTTTTPSGPTTTAPQNTQPTVPQG